MWEKVFCGCYLHLVTVRPDTLLLRALVATPLAWKHQGSIFIFLFLCVPHPCAIWPLRWICSCSGREPSSRPIQGKLYSTYVAFFLSELHHGLLLEALFLLPRRTATLALGSSSLSSSLSLSVSLSLLLSPSLFLWLFPLETDCFYCNNLYWNTVDL